MDNWKERKGNFLLKYTKDAIILSNFYVIMYGCIVVFYICIVIKIVYSRNKVKSSTKVKHEMKPIILIILISGNRM